MIFPMTLAALAFYYYNVFYVLYLQYIYCSCALVTLKLTCILVLTLKVLCLPKFGSVFSPRALELYLL